MRERERERESEETEALWWKQTEGYIQSRESGGVYKK